MLYEGPCTVLGGLPAYAVVDADGEDCFVHKLHWRRKNGSKGVEFSRAMLDKVERYDRYYRCDVCDDVFDHLFCEESERAAGVDHPLEDLASVFAREDA